MKRFIIEIKDNYSIQPQSEGKSVLLIEEYLNILNILKDINQYDDFIKYALMSCDKCKSFILSVKSLYLLIGTIQEYTGGDDLYEIKNKITGITHLSDEQWYKYFIKGDKDIDFIYSKDGDIETDSDGNPYKYLWEECAVIFNSNCECNALLTGNAA